MNWHTLPASWVPSLDIFSSSLRVGVFEEAETITDEEVTVDVDWGHADGTAEVRIFPQSPCCCCIHKLLSLENY
jgi:hypothetical protein